MKRMELMKLKGDIDKEIDILENEVLKKNELDSMKNSKNTDLRTKFKFLV